MRTWAARKKQLIRIEIVMNATRKESLNDAVQTMIVFTKSRGRSSATRVLLSSNETTTGQRLFKLA